MALEHTLTSGNVCSIYLGMSDKLSVSGVAMDEAPTTKVRKIISLIANVKRKSFLIDREFINAERKSLFDRA